MAEYLIIKINDAHSVYGSDSITVDRIKKISKILNKDADDVVQDAIGHYYYNTIEIAKEEKHA